MEGPAHDNRDGHLGAAPSRGPRRRVYLWGGLVTRDGTHSEYHAFGSAADDASPTTSRPAHPATLGRGNYRLPLDNQALHISLDSVGVQLGGDVAHSDVASLEQALTRGVEFVRARQGGDGLWRDFETLAGEGSDWPTAFIGAQLVEAGVRGAAIEVAVGALLRRQHRDGGWGYHHDVPSDADSTAWGLSFLALSGADRYAIERAGRCLQRFQDPRTGGVSTYADRSPIRRYLQAGPRFDVRGWCASHVEVTSTAGRAFALVPGGRFGREAELAWQYVERRQAADGGWDSYWWVDRHYPTSQAAALAVAVGRTEPVERAAAWARSGQLPDGAWGATGFARSAFATALSLAVWLRAADAGPRDDTFRRGLLALVGLRQQDGGWPGHASMRIPPPGVAEPEGYRSWRVDGLGTGVIVRDEHRLFTTAACLSLLAHATGAVA